MNPKIAPKMMPVAISITTRRLIMEYPLLLARDRAAAWSPGAAPADGASTPSRASARETTRPDGLLSLESTCMAAIPWESKAVVHRARARTHAKRRGQLGGSALADDRRARRAPAIPN